MFYQILLLPQVKQNVIISNKHGIYELPYELPNDLKLRNLRLSPPPAIKNSSVLVKIFLKNRN